MDERREDHIRNIQYMAMILSNMKNHIEVTAKDPIASELAITAGNFIAFMLNDMSKSFTWAANELRKKEG